MKAAWQTVLKRLLLVLPVLWIVVSLIFFLIHLVPGDPVEQMLGEGATASDIGALRHAYGSGCSTRHAICSLLGRRAARKSGTISSLQHAGYAADSVALSLYIGAGHSGDLSCDFAFVPRRHRFRAAPLEVAGSKPGRDQFVWRFISQASRWAPF